MRRMASQALFALWSGGAGFFVLCAFMRSPLGCGRPARGRAPWWWLVGRCLPPTLGIERGNHGGDSPDGFGVGQLQALGGTVQPVAAEPRGALAAHHVEGCGRVLGLLAESAAPPAAGVEDRTEGR